MGYAQRRAAIVGVLAEVAVTHRCHATLNPDSLMGGHAGRLITARD
jgi:hypothetical protein